LIVSPRNLAQGASLKSLPSELQGNHSCPVRATRLVEFEFNPFSSQIFSELTRNLHRFPTLKAGIFRDRAIPSSVFQCIPSKHAASWSQADLQRDRLPNSPPQTFSMVLVAQIQ